MKNIMLNIAVMTPNILTDIQYIYSLLILNIFIVTYKSIISLPVAQKMKFLFREANEYNLEGYRH